MRQCTACTHTRCWIGPLNQRQLRERKTSGKKRRHIVEMNCFLYVFGSHSVFLRFWRLTLNVGVCEWQWSSPRARFINSLWLMSLGDCLVLFCMSFKTIFCRSFEWFLLFFFGLSRGCRIRCVCVCMFGLLYIPVILINVWIWIKSERVKIAHLNFIRHLLVAPKSNNWNFTFCHDIFCLWCYGIIHNKPSHWMCCGRLNIPKNFWRFL